MSDIGWPICGAARAGAGGAAAGGSTRPCGGFDNGGSAFDCTPGQRCGTAPAGMLFGGRRGSSLYPSGALPPSADTRSGKSAPHIPGPLIGEMRTRSGVSVTAPELRQATSASRRHASRSPYQ
jgi:hypothetical protein